MRVLWFAGACGYSPVGNTPRKGGYNGGGWMLSLLNEVKRQEGVEMGVCFAMDGQPFKAEQDGVIYYPFANHTKSLKEKLMDLVYYRHPERDEIVWPQYQEQFRRVIDDFNPDVIEIFGSELYLGLATFVAPCPVVLHIQGILSLYIYIYLPPGVSKFSYYFQDWNLKNIYRRFQLYVYWVRSCYREQQVMKKTKHVIGRTEWDYAASFILNPEREYHYGGEILRKEFYEQYVRIIPKKLTIVTTTSGPMYKGFDYVLETAIILKEKMALDFEWIVFGNVKPSFFEKKIDVEHQSVNIRLMGVASASALCETISQSTVYFQPSYIENSPNSVCEAQMLGVPVVATNVGGTSSLIKDGETGFLIPTNDPYMAAYKILNLYNDMGLNETIGSNGRATALLRHNRKAITEDLVETYQEIIHKSKS